MTAIRRLFCIGLIGLPSAGLAEKQTATGTEFRSAWPTGIERTWIGPRYWANRLQDWRITGGRLECLVAGADRNVHLLTHQLGKKSGGFHMSVQVARLQDPAKGWQGWVGFRFAAKGRFDDYRDSAVNGQGINAGLMHTGRLFIADERGHRQANAKRRAESDGVKQKLAGRQLELRLDAQPRDHSMEIRLQVCETPGGALIDEIRFETDSAELDGNVALVCHSPVTPQSAARIGFSDWRLSGEKVEAHPDRAFGPILFVQHTLSRGVLKLTAQMPPVGKHESQRVRLEADRQGDGSWTHVAEAPIDPLARTATFRVEKWDASRDTPYRLVYELTEAQGTRDVEWRGTIRRDPVDKPQIVVAAFTGNNDAGFPNTDVVRHVAAHAPDVLVFTGDQIYERVGGYGVQREPIKMACLDYLRKWYIFGWSYRDLLRDIPAVCLPDDHDVYHGNLWGCNGRAAKGTGKPGQDSGGYTMPPTFVNMVQRTQTSHLPDPYDPTPVEQGIGVYYCPMNYGGISFAIIEDRKFKSAPAELLPEGQVVNGWFQNPDFDPATQADAPGAQLLGERQMKFLREWAGDWGGNAWMKVLVSQTIFADVVTLPPPANTDDVMPKLPLLEPGGYPEGEVPVADADSNSWPQSGRNAAVREIRKCFAFHIAGDQHLGSTIQYGVDEFRDAGFALCVPSVANVWPRRWFPSKPGADAEPGAPRYTGDYLDGFGNRMTVRAVCNPVLTGREPADLADRATGYGIARFHREDRKITIENWPRHADPTDASTGGPYSGWPITVDQLANYARKPAGFLPTLQVQGATDPVVQVLDEANSELVYALRIQGTRFRPMVFKPGTYTLRVSDPDRGKLQVRTGLEPQPADIAAAGPIVIDLR